jgi:hypothetical protein
LPVSTATANFLIILLNSFRDKIIYNDPNATIRPTFQSGAEKPFKMASPISYIVEGLLRISLLNIEN